MTKFEALILRGMILLLTSAIGIKTKNKKVVELIEDIGKALG